MDHPLGLDPITGEKGLFADYDSSSSEPFGGSDLERAAMYQDIAERRAQLECAETLRRVRAL
jgi:hypothetical protein